MSRNPTDANDLCVGVDEVGYGAWAGPLVVCAFALPKDIRQEDIEGLDDSKKLSPKMRERVAQYLMRTYPCNYYIERISAQEIDKSGVWNANSNAMKTVVNILIDRIGIPYDVIIDGIGFELPGAVVLPKADATYPAVMAASVVAKYVRDTYMVEIHKTYPEYGFDRHMGYGTDFHQTSLNAYGPCLAHRMSYKPLHKFV